MDHAKSIVYKGSIDQILLDVEKQSGDKNSTCPLVITSEI